MAGDAVGQPKDWLQPLPDDLLRQLFCLLEPDSRLQLFKASLGLAQLACGSETTHTTVVVRGAQKRPALPSLLSCISNGGVRVLAESAAGGKGALRRFADLLYLLQQPSAAPISTATTYLGIWNLHLQGIELPTQPLPYLGTLCPNLTHLELDKCDLEVTPPPGVGASTLVSLTQLRQLSVSSAGGDLMDSLQQQVQQLPLLGTLTLGPFTTHPLLAALQLPAHITSLCLDWRGSSDCQLPPLAEAELEQLHTNSQLQHLSITGSIAAGHSPSLQHLPNLHHLSLTGQVAEVHMPALMAHNHLTSLEAADFVFSASTVQPVHPTRLRKLTLTNRCLNFGSLPQLPLRDGLQLTHPEVCLTMGAAQQQLPTGFTFAAPHGLRLCLASPHSMARELETLFPHMTHVASCMTLCRGVMGAAEVTALRLADGGKMAPGTTLRLECCTLEPSFWPALRTLLLAGGLAPITKLVFNECRGLTARPTEGDAPGAAALCSGWGEERTNGVGRRMAISVRVSTQDDLGALVTALGVVMAHDGGLREMKRPDGWSLHVVLGPTAPGQGPADAGSAD